MHRYARPGSFMRFSKRLLPFLALASVGCLAFGLYLALLASPPDYQQGDTVRIMYIHVPSAMVAMGAYSMIALCSAMYLIWKHPLSDMLAQASALPGAACALLTLVTGSLWGKPMWGAYWVWDARLTSFLLLFFLYLGYIAFGSGGSENNRKSAAILALIGFVNIPIIKYSVDWWSTLHQPASLLKLGKPAIDGSMLTPLLVMIAGFAFFFATVLILRAQAAILERKIERIRHY